MKILFAVMILSFLPFASHAHRGGCESPVEARDIVRMYIDGRLYRIYGNSVDSGDVYFSNELGLKYILKCVHRLESHYLVFRDGKYEKYYYSAEVVSNTESHKWMLRSVRILNDEGVELFNEENEI